MNLVSWLEEYKKWLLEKIKIVQTIEPVTFKFKFIYFNSSSAKFIYDIILVLSDMQKSNIPLKLYWYFDEDDDELREAGEELSDMANVPFHYVEISH
ncbi:MAG TPA: SiaC family regulatory phosphoprotein, partial [Tenuifilaceae bacterium]|nr:SiaC family regulatory phosphoprotein [Tenuifilaceae bacterium]